MMKLSQPTVYVPLVLTVMGFLFYIPALLWKFLEGGSVHSVTLGRNCELTKHIIIVHNK